MNNRGFQRGRASAWDQLGPKSKGLLALAGLDTTVGGHLRSILALTNKTVVSRGSARNPNIKQGCKGEGMQWKTTGPEKKQILPRPSHILPGWRFTKSRAPSRDLPHIAGCTEWPLLVNGGVALHQWRRYQAQEGRCNFKTCYPSNPAPAAQRTPVYSIKQLKTPAGLLHQASTPPEWYTHIFGTINDRDSS